MAEKSKGLGYTREVLISDAYPHIILYQDPNRMDLSIFNLSTVDTVYIALGVLEYPELLEEGKYPKELAIPLYPGEAFEPSVIPYNDVTLFLDEFTVDVAVTVSYTTLLPELVQGEASP